MRAEARRTLLPLVRGLLWGVLEGIDGTAGGLIGASGMSSNAPVGVGSCAGAAMAAVVEAVGLPAAAVVAALCVLCAICG